MTAEERLKAIQTKAKLIGDKIHADVILLSTGIYDPLDRNVIEACANRRRRDNVLLLLTTSGGSADVAYRISRCLQDKYKKFVVLISGQCKSSGTIIALGANELILTDLGQLGPLDVQLRKADELWELSSGLVAWDALSSLQQKAFAMFEKYLVDLKIRSGGQITLKTAAEIASHLTAGLYGEIFAQVDPMKLGENTRSMNISQQYGDRLGVKGGNIHDGTVAKLTAAYPSHSFVIDREEAKTLFKQVRSPSDDELQLVKLLGEIAITESPSVILDFLNDELPAANAILPAGAINGQSNQHGNGGADSAETAAGVVASREDSGPESDGDREPGSAIHRQA